MFTLPLLSRKPIALGSITLLVLGIALILVPAIPQTLFSLYALSMGKNLDVLFYVNVVNNMFWINSIPLIIGGLLLCVFASRVIKAHCKIDTSKIKQQSLHLATWSLIGLLSVGCFVLMVAPTSKAMGTATTGYILDTPVSDFDYLIGQYSDGNYYAINGSTWDNLVSGVGSTAWAGYTSNYTKLEELALSSLDTGIIALKETYFNYSLTIPENVTVLESVNGLERSFINSANTQGSPYTVSVDTVDSTYYVCKDFAGRFINDFTSTNASYTVNSALDGLTAGRTSQETVCLQGNFTQTHSFVVSSHTKLHLDGKVTLADGANCDQIVNAHPTAFDSDIEIEGGTYDGNGDEQSGASSGLVLTTATEDTSSDVTRIHDISFHGQKTNGITITNSASYHNPYFVSNIWCHDIGEIGMDLYNLVDSQFSDLILQGNDGNLRVVGGYLKFNHLYLAGSNYWNLRCYGTAMWFTDVFADYNTENGFCPVLLDGCKWSHFSGFTIRNLGSANNNTNSAVKVSLSTYDGTTYSVSNTFSDFVFIKTGTAFWKYGIEETDNANTDNNQYCNINGLAVATATLYLRGTTSKEQHTNIIGNVTEV
jgi:hypothetical protein